MVKVGLENACMCLALTDQILRLSETEFTQFSLKFIAVQQVLAVSLIQKECRIVCCSQLIL